MANHCPGPWYVDGAWILTAAGDLVAQVNVCNPRIAPNINGNAALIGTAPELFDLATQYASECGECAGTGITPDDQDCSECKFIRDVIAKATGASG